MCVPPGHLLQQSTCLPDQRLRISLLRTAATFLSFNRLLRQECRKRYGARITRTVRIGYRDASLRALPSRSLQHALGGSARANRVDKAATSPRINARAFPDCTDRIPQAVEGAISCR